MLLSIHFTSTHFSMALAQNSSKFLQRKSLHAHRISPFSPKAGMAATDGEGAKVKTDLSDDRVSATFIIREEDHTLGNSLRYVLAKNEKTSFVGYSVPHPSEPVMNLRLQAQEDQEAVEVFRESCGTLMNICDHVLDTFNQAEADFKSGKQKMTD